MAIKLDDIIVLIGAGCSADANIPTASQMMRKIEEGCLNTDAGDFKNLYNYVKSAIIYGQGIQGKFDVPINVEDLINVLTELEKRERNLVFPFIANWNNLLTDLAGTNFTSVTKFKKVINTQLLQWVKRDNYERDASYYTGFYGFQKELELPLRVFSLNYDLCFEKLAEPGYRLELGFDQDRNWDYRRFEGDENAQVSMYLYKLHGSVDWKRENNQLIRSDSPVDNPELIFGIPAKLQSYDPYLFYIYELRKYSLQSKLIIVIGYSFGDDHINDLLRQALQLNPIRRLLCIEGGSVTVDHVKENIKNRLSLATVDQVEVACSKAKDFLQNQLKLAQIEPRIIADDEQPFR